MVRVSVKYPYGTKVTCMDEIDGTVTGVFIRGRGRTYEFSYVDNNGDPTSRVVQEIEISPVSRDVIGFKKGVLKMSKETEAGWLDTREGLQRLREDAVLLAEFVPNNHWRRAYRQLADALDRLDAMESRTEEPAAITGTGPHGNSVELTDGQAGDNLTGGQACCQT